MSKMNSFADRLSSRLRSESPESNAHASRKGPRLRRKARRLLVESLEARKLLTVLPGDSWSWALAEGGLKDGDSGLVWSTSLPNWDWADYSYATSEVDNLQDGGQTDWRLPTKAELEEAMAHGLEHHHTKIDNYWHWTSTAGNNNKQHWQVNSSGATQLANNGGYSGVVAVRGIRSPATHTVPNVRLFSTNIFTDESPNDKGWLTVALDTQPTADVVVSMLAEDTTEGLLSARGETPAAGTTLTFTSANWNVPQWVAVHAVDDPFDDGDVTYRVSVDASSADTNYAALDPADVFVTNRNYDRAVVDVSPTLLVTHEYGSSAEFEVALQVPPASGPVYVDLVSSNPAEATIDKSSLTFDSTNWNVKQKVTVTGVNDVVADGDAQVSIVTSIGAGSSSEFVTNPADVLVTNVDDDLMTHTYSSGALNLSIPDPGTVSSSLNIADVYSVGDVNVKVNLSHTYDRDLRVYLIGPDSTRVELFTDVGGSGDHFTNTELDDEATVSIAAGSGTAIAPFTGRFRPEGALSGFDGKSVTGVWKLEVTDARRQDRGKLLNWSLVVGEQFVPAPLLAETARSTHDARSLAENDVAPMLQAAARRWQLMSNDAIDLSNVDIRIADLGGRTLGLAAGNTMWLDDDAAGWGWFVDRTPGNDREFAVRGDQGEQNRMDLLTVVMHELGHLLGHDHDSDGVMAETLTPGMRRAHNQNGHTASVDEVFQGAGINHQVSRWSGWWFDQSESQRPWTKRRR